MQDQIRLNQAIALAKEQDAKAVEAKRQAGAALLQDIMAGNARMVAAKKEEKLRAVAEDQRILAYIRERDAKAQVVTDLIGHFCGWVCQEGEAWV